MDIAIHNATRRRIQTSLLRRAADIVGQKMKVPNASVSVALVGERRIRTLNRQYRGRDAVTDILSFAEPAIDSYLGEVVLCYPQIRRQAKQLRVGTAEELVFIFVHGLLHLLGYDDKTLKGWREMERLGTQLCKSILRQV